LGSDLKRLRGIWLKMTRFFFEGNRKSAIFEKKRSSDRDKFPEDQGDEPKTQVRSQILILEREKKSP
jgi:hypothetical protein